MGGTPSEDKDWHGTPAVEGGAQWSEATAECRDRPECMASEGKA